MLTGTLPRTAVAMPVGMPVGMLVGMLVGQRAQAAAPAAAAPGTAASFAAPRRIWLQRRAGAAAPLPTGLAALPLARAPGPAIGRAPPGAGRPPQHGRRAAMAVCGVGRLRALAQLRRGARHR